MEAMLMKISGFLWVQGWQVALLTVVVGLLTWALRNRSAHVRYLLWLIVLAKCVVPPVHTVRLPVLPLGTEVLPAWSEPAGKRPMVERGGTTQAAWHNPPQVPTDAIVPIAEPMTTKPLGIPRLATRAWFGIAWATGLGGFVLIVAIKALSTGLWLRRERKPLPGLLADEINCDLTAFGVRHTPRVWLIDGVGQPFVWGLVHASIYLPLGFGQMGDRQGRRNLLGHELCHVLRLDAAVNAVQVMVQGVFWFHPFVWWVNKRIRAEREKCCDEMAVARLGAPAKDYSTAIVNMLMSEHRSTQPVPSLAVAGPVNNIEERIKTMMRPGMKFYGRPSRAAAVGVLLIACLTVPISLLLTTQAGERTGPATDKTAPAVPQADSAGASEKPLLTGESNVFVDPQTGIRFTKFKTISGPSDIIEYGNGLDISPNGKFLLWGVHVIPLAGGGPFDLVDMPNALRGSLSPDGRKVVFYCGAMWLIEVDPETGRPEGPAKKLLEGFYWHQYPVLWSSDSKKIIFVPRDNQLRSGIWTLSLETGEQSQVTDPFSLGLVSPDGKTIACSDCQGMRGTMPQSSLRVKPVAGGDARKLSDLGYPVVWSANSEWLVCNPGEYDGFWRDEVRFVRVADGHEVKVKAPGCWVRQFPYGRKLLFYRVSYNYGNIVLKVVSVAGGQPADLGLLNGLSVRLWGFHSWTPDARSILVEGEQEGSPWNLYAVPLDGKDLRSLTIDTPLCQQAKFRRFSPDGTKLLLGVKEKGRPYDLWVVPISLAQMKSTGPAVKVFGGMVQSIIVGGESEPFLDAWSPDSTKIALSHKGDIWVVSADGQNPVQLTETPEDDLWPDWSPDGTMIAFQSHDRSQAETVIRVVPPSGGEERVIAEGSFQMRGSAWSPDGKELTILSKSGEVISSFPISGGNARTVLRPKNTGIDNVRCLRWSPDGRFLAFEGGIGRSDQKLYVYHPDSAKLEPFDCDEQTRFWYWSPNSKWISFASQPVIKTRPEGILWEMDVEEALAKVAK